MARVTSSQQPGTFNQGGITSSLKFPFYNHIEDNVEFGLGGGGGGGWGVDGGREELKKEVFFFNS